MSEYKTNYWLQEKEIQDLEFSSYWNDEEKEKNKEWYILDGNFMKMEEYIQNSNLLNAFLSAYLLAHNHGFTFEDKVGLNLAAGTLWLEVELFELCTPKKIYSVEMSHHRLLKIGKKMLAHYNVPVDKIELCLGSFYDLKLNDNSMDFIVLSSAFHHASEPDKLLNEVTRVLKDDGFIVLMGESEVEDTTRSDDDKMMGDFYYTRKEYERMFNKYNLTMRNSNKFIGSGTILYKNCLEKEYKSLNKFINGVKTVGILGSGRMGLKLKKYLVSIGIETIFVHDSEVSDDVKLLKDNLINLDAVIIAISDKKIAFSKLKYIPIRSYIASTGDIFFKELV